MVALFRDRAVSTETYQSLFDGKQEVSADCTMELFGANGAEVKEGLPNPLGHPLNPAGRANALVRVRL